MGKQAAEEISCITAGAMQLQAGVDEPGVAEAEESKTAVKEVEGRETRGDERPDVGENVAVGVREPEPRGLLKETEGFFTGVEHAAEGFVAEVEQVFTGPMDEPRHTPAKDVLVEEPVVKDTQLNNPIVKEAPEEWQGAR